MNKERGLLDGIWKKEYSGDGGFFLGSVEPGSLAFFRFDSFIYNPLHGARRAMAAAGFSNITFSYPGSACAVKVGCLKAPSPHNPPYKGKRENAFVPPDKRKTKEKYILEGRAWPILFLARAYSGPFRLLPLDLQ